LIDLILVLPQAASDFNLATGPLNKDGQIFAPDFVVGFHAQPA